MIFQRNLLPWYQGVIYQGAMVAGQWTGLIGKDEEGTSHITLELDQIAHQLKGLGMITWVDRETPEAFDFEGQIQDGYVVGIFRPRDRRKFFLVTTMLKLHPTGKSLDGLVMLRNMDDNKFVSIEVSWQRTWRD